MILGILGLDDRGSISVQTRADATVNGPFPQRLAEGLGDLICLRLDDEVEARCDASESNLIHEVIYRALRTAPHARRRTRISFGSSAIEFAQQSLCDLQGGEPTVSYGRTDAVAPGVETILRGKHSDSAVIHNLSAHVAGGSHLVRAVRRDFVILRSELVLSTLTRRRQSVFLEQARPKGAVGTNPTQDTRSRISLGGKRRSRPADSVDPEKKLFDTGPAYSLTRPMARHAHAALDDCPTLRSATSGRRCFERLTSHELRPEVSMPRLSMEYRYGIDVLPVTVGGAFDSFRRIVGVLFECTGSIRYLNGCDNAALRNHMTGRLTKRRPFRFCRVFRCGGN